MTAIAAPTPAHFDRADVLGRDDEHLDAPSVSIYLHDDMARVLLTARGWTIEPQIGGGHAFVKPGGKLRGRGGKFGDDFLWEIDDALTMALRAEAVANGFEG